MGKGSGGGVGNGNGNGYGDGSGGGMGGGVFRIGGGVSAPMVLSKTEPEYSEEARKAKYQGTVVLMIIVDEKGMPQNIRVVRPLGLGLDEKAIEAVQKWRFRPAMKDGHAVKVEATVEVNFRLL
jgi:TonB family protein